MRRNGWKQSEITPVHENYALEEMKDNFEEFQNFSKTVMGSQQKIVIFINFSKFQNSLQSTSKLGEITLFHKNDAFKEIISCFEVFHNSPKTVTEKS